ncbi:unnamed protein product [Effrenium voratum]|nr:unnamed protein product [Effrenium voratum]
MGMSEEILQEVRSEVDQSANSLRGDVAGMLERREETSNQKLTQLDEKMEQVVSWAKCGYVDFSKFDFGPVLDEIRSNETLHAESSQKMSQRLDENFVLIGNTLDKLTNKAEEEDVKVGRLLERMKRSEEKLGELSELLKGTSQQVSKLKDFQSQSAGSSQDVSQNLQQVAQRLRPLETSSQAIREGLRQISESMGSDTTALLNEIGKIQQAMNLDFVRTTPGGEEIAIAAVAVVEPDPKPGPAPEKAKRTRVREFFTQTLEVESSSKTVQTDPKMLTEKKKEKFRPKQPNLARQGTASARSRGFNDPDSLKKKARQALLKPPYNVFDYYHDTGIFQTIAKSLLFDYLSLTVVCLNAIWIAVDADLNGAAVITNAEPPFIVVENLFCTYFFAEVFIRFMAFAQKSRCLRDRWFVFDSLLVLTMVLETWIAPIIILGFNIDLANALDLSTLRMFRMVKLLRLSRMAKLLRAVPELTIIMKGINLATRSVLVFFLFWMIIIYVFALVLRQVTEGNSIGTTYFSTVPESVNNLLLYGILPDQRELITATLPMGAWMWPLIVTFFLLVSITIMYMLVGVLVDVMRVISATEKEGITISYLANEFREKMDQLQYNTEMPLSQFEFQKLLLEPDIALILASEGIDVIALVDSLDLLYEDIAKNGRDGLEFSQALDLVLNMRGGNPATVKDVKEQLRLTKSLVKTSQWAILDKMNVEFAHVLSLLKELREEALKRDGLDGDLEDDDFDASLQITRLGTSEDQLIRVICQLNFGERREVKEADWGHRAYQRMFDKDLTMALRIEHVQSETSGDFQKALLCMLQAEEAPFDLEALIHAFRWLEEGWGTDETLLTTMVCNKTSKQMEDVNKKFKELYERDLLAWVQSETSGHYKSTLVGCIRHPMKQLAHSVRDCMQGWGTDDEGLITCLVHLEDFKKAALIREYKAEFDRDIFEDIKSDTSGDYQRALCSLVKAAPEVWAEALIGAMKGLGTADELLINFMVLGKEDMMSVRKEFHKLNGKLLEVSMRPTTMSDSATDWIESETSGDYKKTLLMLAGRNSEENLSLAPVYWAQRCKDALFNIQTLQEVLVAMPATAIKRHTELYEAVYGASLKKELEKKCEAEVETGAATQKFVVLGHPCFPRMPVELYVRGLWDAMNGIGTDEYTLTALVCTLPKNLYDEIHGLYEKTHQKKLVDHIESETSFSYKKVLKFQAMKWAESRATALHGAMAGWGTSEDQLIRVIICSTFKERRLIREAYQRLFERDLIEHVQSETSGNFKNILVAVLKCTHPKRTLDYEKDCEDLKAAMDGVGTNERAIIQIVAGKTPQQIETLKAKFQEKFGEDLYARIDSETWDCGTCIFLSANFRACMLGLLTEPALRLAGAVRDCIVGWGTDDTGLITLLVHLSERQRRDLVDKYAEVKNGGDLFQAIKGDTSGEYERALLALVKPPPQVWAEAIMSSMKGLGTSDNLLINWMCIAKERMDEVRDHFYEQDGRGIAKWIDGDCSGDYKDTLVRLANRRCERFAGQEVGLSISPPMTKEDGILKFTKTFNKLCRLRKQKGENIMPGEEDQQAMGNAFLYYGSLSSCAPNLDVPGLWDLTNACNFPPGDDCEDLVATFNEWDVSGTGEITWNDFVREMTTRINDPNHFEAPPLPETADMINIPDKPLSDAWKTVVFNASDDDYEAAGLNMVQPGGECAICESGELMDDPAAEPAQPAQPAEPAEPAAPWNDDEKPDMFKALNDGTWKEKIAGVQPQVDGDLLAGLWADLVSAACWLEVKEQWQGRFPEAPVGLVITHLASEHADFVPAAERTEQATKGYLSEQEKPQEAVEAPPAKKDMYQELINGTWKEAIAGVQPQVDGDLLAGLWADLITGACWLEVKEQWQGRFPEAPVGMVITHLASEHADFVPAAERTEQARHLVRDHFLGFRRFALPTGHWKSQAGTACPICQCIGNHSLFN